MDFFDRTGKMAIGSRLRLLTDLITKDAASIYELYGVDIRPKWFPVFYVLAHGEPKPITAIAKEIGHSHPSVSNIVKEMIASKLVKEVTDKSDKRRTVITLSAKGKRMAEILEVTCADVGKAVEEISGEARNDLWRAIAEWEYLLSQKTLLQRVKEVRKERESKEIRIVPYAPYYQFAFRSLNEHWISTYFKMEEEDYRELDHPEEYILNPGGVILVALYKEEPVGVCALVKMEHSVYDYELAKYAVDPRAQGLGIGFSLGGAIVEKARELGAKRLYLVSNTSLKPALHIYRKLGFKELEEYLPTDYERADIQMELTLE